MLVAGQDAELSFRSRKHRAVHATPVSRASRGQNFQIEGHCNFPSLGPSGSAEPCGPLAGLLDGPHHVEGLLRQLVVTPRENLPKTANRVL